MNSFRMFAEDVKLETIRDDIIDEERADPRRLDLLPGTTKRKTARITVVRFLGDMEVTP